MSSSCCNQSWMLANNHTIVWTRLTILILSPFFTISINKAIIVWSVQIQRTYSAFKVPINPIGHFVNHFSWYGNKICQLGIYIVLTGEEEGYRVYDIGKLKAIVSTSSYVNMTMICYQICQPNQAGMLKPCQTSVIILGTSS